MKKDINNGMATVNEMRESLQCLREFLNSSDMDKLLNPNRHDVPKVEYEAVIDCILAELHGLYSETTFDF